MMRGVESSGVSPSNRSNTARRVFLGSVLTVLIIVTTGCEWLGLIEPTPQTEFVTSGSRFEFQQPAMGVEFRIVMYADDREQAETAARHAWEELERIEQCLSDYRRDSEINLLCQSAPHDEPVPVSDTLLNALLIAKNVFELSDGAFDVTVGPVSHIWRAAIKRNRLPDPERIEEARKAVGFDKLIIADGGRVQLTVPGMQLDFGGLAKGLAADRMLDVMERDGVDAALVDASGDISVRGTPQGTSAWTISLPRLGGRGDNQFALRSGSVATSGDFFQSLEVDGKRYSHIVDPRTGQAVSHASQATVFAANGALADALASACCVVSPGDATGLIISIPDAEILVYGKMTNDEGARVQSLETSGIQPMRRRN